MEINRPATRALTAAEQRAMDHFRARIHALALNGGLTSQTVTNVVTAMKAHPDFSSAILQVLLDEFEELRQIAPGVSLFELD
jgi:hypothetical protein